MFIYMVEKEHQGHSKREDVEDDEHAAAEARQVLDHLHVYMHTCTCVYISASICVDLCIYMHVCVYIHILYTHTHRYT